MIQLLRGHPEWLHDPEDAGSLAKALSDRLLDQRADYGDIPDWSDLGAQLERLSLRREAFDLLGFAKPGGPSEFQVLDYTKKILQNPEKFSATELCRPGSLKQKSAILFSTLGYGLVPTYIFLLISFCLKRPRHENASVISNE